MIAKLLAAEEVHQGDYVLEGGDVPRWRKIEEVEFVEREGIKIRRIWMADGPGYYDLRDGDILITGDMT